MSSTGYVPPAYHSDAFNCPSCNAYAHQEWFQGYSSRSTNSGRWADDYSPMANLEFTFCDCCSKYSVWINGSLVYPSLSIAPLPNPDMPDEIRRDYEEARIIAQVSPRGAAALLRLCVQKICIHLGYKDMEINDAIGKMVTEKGLPTMIQKALDSVRVIGNNAVHPGEMDIRDDSETAIKLFTLVNLIAYNQITQPKEVDALYETLPKGTKASIEKRDAKK